MWAGVALHFGPDVNFPESDWRSLSTKDTEVEFQSNDTPAPRIVLIGLGSCRAPTQPSPEKQKDRRSRIEEKSIGPELVAKVSQKYEPGEPLNTYTKTHL